MVPSSQASNCLRSRVHPVFPGGGQNGRRIQLLASVRGPVLDANMIRTDFSSLQVKSGGYRAGIGTNWRGRQPNVPRACPTLLALAFDRLLTIAALRKVIVDPAVQMLRVRSFVNAYLADGALSSSMTGASLGMTFSAAEGVQRWHEMEFAQCLLDVRLSRGAQALADAGYNDYCATEIARMYGLARTEQFCVAFVAAYGRRQTLTDR